MNLFIASTLDWRERDIKVTQHTRFPDFGQTQIKIESSKKQAVKLRIRQPSWCAVMTIDVNTRRQKTLRRAGGYVELTVKTGDTLEIRLPMALRIEALPNDERHAALIYGPIVLAGRFGTEGLEPGAQLIVNERESGNMLQADVQIPRWNKPLEQLVANTTRTNPDRLEFRTTGFDGGASVNLLPWFRLTHERYNLYWQRSA